MNRTTLLTLSLACLAGEAARAQDDPMETRVYNVEFLTKTVEDWPGIELGLGEEVLPEVTAEESSPSLDADTLVDLIRNNIAEDSWEHQEAGIDCVEGRMRVTNRKSVHVKIAEYLAYLRAIAGRMITVDATIVRIDPALLAKIRASSPADQPAILSAEQVNQIIETAREGKQAEWVNAMRVTAHQGQRVSLHEATQQIYLRDYDIQLATGSALPDPVPDKYSIGTVVDVRPTIEPFGNAIALEIRATVADTEGIEERKILLTGLPHGATQDVAGEDKGAIQPPNDPRPFSTESTIQLPRVTVEAIRNTVTVREGRTILIGGTNRKGRSLIFLLTPAIVPLEEKSVQEPASEEQRLLRVYDISPAVRGLENFSGPRIDTLRLQGVGLPGAVFTVEEPAGLRVQANDVIDMIKTRIAPDSWSNRRNQIWLADPGTLLIRQKPEVLKEIDQYLETLLSFRAVMITTEATLLGFRRGSRAEWAKTIPGLGMGGTFVEPDPFAKLLDESGSGTRVRVIDRAEVTGFPQQRVYAARLLEESYLQDYEPQISEYSGMYDPVVDTLRTGFVLDVRPHFLEDTSRVAVDLRCAFSAGELKKMEGLTMDLNFLQLPRLSGFRWNSTIICVKDRYTVAAVESRRVGDEMEELVLLVRARANALK
ncbi:MAG: hypothetical protein HYY16_19530 [Planctomycetes bacterium]|nr:hypothetical protein [Planctomycetota bacterium]